MSIYEPKQMDIRWLLNRIIHIEAELRAQKTGEEILAITKKIREEILAEEDLPATINDVVQAPGLR